MSKKITTQDFIEKSKIIHGDKYDYSLVDYVNKKTKVKIMCSFHGVFEQLPPTHIKGSGCKRCATTLVNNDKRIKYYDFIERSNKIHNFKYDYSLINKNEKLSYLLNINIICPVHGIFEQSIQNHLRGGCIKCRIDNNKNTLEKFIENSKITHYNKYDYSLVDYKNNKTKVKIICPTHGVFEQIPDSHIIGKGCSKCSNNGSDINFKNKKLYILYDKKEKLYKIGISKNVKNRIKDIIKTIDSKYILFLKEYSLGSSLYENKIHKLLKKKRKNHPIEHGGYTEWFDLNKNDLLLIDKIIKL